MKGDADKAESSFFKINTKGTPLDEIEELLLKNRAKPSSIASRAIIRSGRGHRYWSRFSPEVVQQIESRAKSLHSSLFDPEIQRPIKTLDLPLGGPKGIRTALETLIDLMLIAVRDQLGEPRRVESLPDDPDGQLTLKTLAKALDLIGRITGNDGGSLGLHPAVYFYGPTGRHSSALFMGTVALVGQKLANNDKNFFNRFTSVRADLERVLIDHKDVVATILQRTSSAGRVARYMMMLGKLIEALGAAQAVGEIELVQFAGLEGKILTGTSDTAQLSFSQDVKSAAFIQTALLGAMKCPICSGYLDPEKSISYDHIVRAREGGTGSIRNIQLTHPYCNQSVKS
ncbi:HNH endonuclease [Paucibacter sp. B2R-40]|uniref:HNH endonuclease signature motif containing protein n=1 Tax=Paucibacter sp. B2R-40 TaxID=2893554 RepID=UPI0021E3AD3C|nr:HNH endonuclease signature motif containing protein [Paucibacter sp. B2R-40]MCV2352618.1 HNH endonuclease [Paucibacter sp. B2R-40]